MLTVTPAMTTACPRDADLRASVVARLGYDPFALDAARVALVDVAPDGGELVARVRLLGADGAPEGARELRGSRTNCADLFGSVAFTLAVAVDPLSVDGPRPEPPAPSPPPPPPSEPMPTPRAEPVGEPPRPSAPRRIARLGAGVVGSIGSAPSPTVGLTIGAELGLFAGGLTLGLGARGDLPASGDDARGQRPVASLLVGEVSACAASRVIGCAIFTGGVVRANSTGTEGADPRYPLFTASGLRAAFDAPLGEAVTLRPYVEGQFVFTRHRLEIDEESRFTYPALMAGLGVVAFGGVGP